MSTIQDPDSAGGTHDTARDDDAADDTIAAIATPPGAGGIGIVRVSGLHAFAIGAALFRPARARGGAGRDYDEGISSHVLRYGHVVDPRSGEVIDEVMAAFMRAPHTYTREDVVELQGHGGPLLLARVLELALRAGARAARPGEMTLRAFLNGRLDLAQAEAVMGLIAAESDAGRRLAMRQLQGELSRQVGRAREAALRALVQIEATIDFPEEEVPAPDRAELHTCLVEAADVLANLLRGAERGRLVRDGLHLAIVGRPNVGKSSLLNALLRMERAIVTPIAGTTRDTVEERVMIGGVAVHLTDTAGLTPTDDPIERLGVERSRQAARGADMVLLVLDGAAPLSPPDSDALAEVRTLLHDGDSSAAAVDGAAVARALIVLNKSDLPERISDDEAQQLWPGARVVRTSCVSPGGVAALEAVIGTIVGTGEAQGSSVLVTSARHHDALRRAHEQLSAADGTLDAGLPLDFVAIDLRAALDALGEITGETASAHLLDRIFAEFCIGK